MQLAGVKAVGVACFSQKLLRLRRVVRIGLNRQRELERLWDMVPGGLGCPQRLGVAQRLSVDCIVRARRMRRSCQGDFGSHWSKKSR